MAIKEWRAVFLMGATVHFIGITIYGIFASGELQPWAEPTPPYEAPLKSLDQETTFVSIHHLIELSTSMSLFDRSLMTKDRYYQSRRVIPACMISFHCVLFAAMWT